MAIEMSMEEFVDLRNNGTVGICRLCHNQQYGVEPAAENYECDSCGEMEVFGVEQLLLLGEIKIK